MEKTNEVKEVLFNKQRYEFFSKSQRIQDGGYQVSGCCSISKDTNFSANHNRKILALLMVVGVVQ